MGDVIYLDQPTALTLNMFRGSINWMKLQNKDGRYNEAIDRESSIYKSMFAEVCGKDN